MIGTRKHVRNWFCFSFAQQQMLQVSQNGPMWSGVTRASVGGSKGLMSGPSFHPNCPQALKQQKSQRAVQKTKSGKKSLRNCAGVSDQTQLQQCGVTGIPRFSPYARHCSFKETSILTLISSMFLSGSDYTLRVENMYHQLKRSKKRREGERWPPKVSPRHIPRPCEC